MRRWIILLTLLLFLLIPAGAAKALPPADEVVGEGDVIDEDMTLFGEDLEVAEGGVINGDVSLFGGELEVAEGGAINGDVVVGGGSVELAGEIDGELTIFGGDLDAAETATVGGECVLLGGEFSSDGDVDLACSSTRDFESAFPGMMSQLHPFGRPNRPDQPESPERPDGPPPTVENRDPSFFARFMGVIGRTVAMGLLAIVLAALAPRHLDRVGRTALSKPVISGTVGLLTAAAGTSLLVLLAVISALLTLVCIGILGFPIVIALAVLLAGAALFGWVAIGAMLGKRLAEKPPLASHDLMMTTAAGTAILTFALGLLSILPAALGGWAVWLATWALILIGLGATALTQFGRSPYPVADQAKVSAVMATIPEENEEPPL